MTWNSCPISSLVTPCPDTIQILRFQARQWLEYESQIQLYRRPQDRSDSSYSSTTLLVPCHRIRFQNAKFPTDIPIPLVSVQILCQWQGDRPDVAGSLRECGEQSFEQRRTQDVWCCSLLLYTFPTQLFEIQALALFRLGRRMPPIHHLPSSVARTGISYPVLVFFCVRYSGIGR